MASSDPVTDSPRRLAALSTLLLVATATAAHADPRVTRSEFDDLDLGVLLDSPAEVWTASKTEQNIHEAPAIITTVTRDQIAVWGHRSVAEVLSELLGFFVVDDHTAPNLAVRGISGGLYADSSIVKVLINGQDVAFHSTSGNWLGPELVPLSAIERIEVVRGPASALFGADAFLGVINIQTRTGKSLGGGAASLGLGRVGKKLATDVDGAVGFDKGPLDLMFAARQTDQDLSGLTLPGSSPAPAVPAYNHGSREARGLDQSSTVVLGRVGYRPRARTSLGVFGYFSALRRGAEFGSLVQLANGTSAEGVFSENRVSLAQLRAGGYWEEELGDRLRFALRAQVFRGAPRDDNRLEVGSEFHYVRRRFGFRGIDADSQIEWTPAWLLAGRVRLVAGLSAFVDDESLPSRVAIAKQETQAHRAGATIDALSIHQGDKTFVNTGAFLQAAAQVIDDGLLGINGAIRYDQHNIYGGQTSGRVGLVTNPRPNLHAKLLYGGAFKAPSPLLLYAVPSAIGDVTGNPQLAPQYVRTAELQLAGEVGDSVVLSSNLAYSVLGDKTEFVQQGINRVARNVARASTLSWESRAEVKWQGIVRAHVSFELQRTLRQTGEDGYSGEVVGREGGIYPRTMTHAGIVTHPPRWPVRFTMQASHVGTRRPSDTNILLNAGSYALPPYLILDAGIATVEWRLFGAQNRHVSFALKGSNLLDAQGPAPGFSGVDYPLAPRSLFLQMNVGL